MSKALARPRRAVGALLLMAGVLVASAAGAERGAMARPDSSAGAERGATARPDSTAEAAARGIVRLGGSRRLTLTGAEVKEPLELPDRLIVAGTDSVSADGRALERGVGYSLDYGRSLLSVRKGLSDSARVVVSYLYVPLKLSPVYRHAVLDSTAALPPGFDRGGVLLAQADTALARTPPAGLTVGGAKTFGITMGSNRDPTLEQSLRLNIAGNITRDVAVRAYLSDQNTPLVPEGDTEELRALDKVLIEIESERLSATMGDIVFALDGGTLASFRRELTGASFHGDLGRASVLLAGARTAGEFMSMTFRGVDGRQGTYLLTDDGGGVGVPIVAGSERVWLDGERLLRGRDNDYVIDYRAGGIEFTERRRITSESEITVDYEFAVSDYDRDIYGGRLSASLGSGSVTLGGTFFREADDRGASSTIALSDEQIAVLEAAGDDVELAHDDGVDSVGAGNGDYERAYLPEFGVFAFRYAGPDSGDFDLSFERHEGGDYGTEYFPEHDTFAFAYAGAGAGDYRLGRSLPLPSDLVLSALDGRFEFGDGGFVEAEAALSEFDANTLSELNDTDNSGNAEVVTAAAPDLSFGAAGGGTVGLEVRARRVGGAFQSVGRFRDVRYVEKWELVGLDLPPGELMVEGGTTVSLSGGGEITLTAASLERGDVLDSTRGEFSLRLSPSDRSRVWSRGRAVGLDYAGAGSAERRERERLEAGGDHLFGLLRPGVRYAHDSRTNAAGGERYDEYAASLASAGTRSVSFSIDYAHRLTDRREGAAWERASTTRTQTYRFDLAGSERLSLDARVSRRVTEHAGGIESPDSKHDLASLRATHRSFGGGLAGELRYTVTSTEIEEKERFVIDDEGVLVTRVVSTGRYLPVTDLAASTKWTVKFLSRGGRDRPEPSAWRRFLAGLTLESDVKLRETTTTSEKRRLYLLDPSVIRGDDTVKGEVSARHVARYLASDGSLSVRLALRTRDLLDRSFANTSDETAERRGTVDVKLSRRRGTTFRIQADVGVRDRESGGAGSSYEIDERSLLGEVRSRRFGDVDLTLTGVVASQNDALSGIEVTELRLTPSVTYRFRGRGAASASFTRTEIESSTDALPYYLAGGGRPGPTSEWRLTGDYRFNRYLTGSLSYNGERRPESDTRHTVDLRVNAFF